MGGMTVREGQTFAGESLLVRYVNFVKLPHTVFALPFALLGLLVASRQHAITWRTLGLVVLAFTCARFVALGFNRIADRELDAKNPRTRARELPSGRLTLRQAWVAVLGAAGPAARHLHGQGAARAGAGRARPLRDRRGPRRGLLRGRDARRGTHCVGAPARDAGGPVASRCRLFRRQRPGECRRVPRRISGSDPITLRISDCGLRNG